MAGTDKAQLFPKLQELHIHQGKTWNEIAYILNEQGYDLSANALRKRFTRWIKTATASKTSGVSEPESKQEHGQTDFGRLQNSRMDSALKQFDRGGADLVASLVTLNKKLLEQMQETNKLLRGLENLLEEQEHKTRHTEHTDDQPVTTRELLELLNEITSRRDQMQYIYEKDCMERKEIQELIDDRVQDQVDAELRTMLTEQGSFSKQLNHLIDRRLKTVFTGGEPVSEIPQAGPGRGKKGKTHKKFSASLEESLFERVKSLPGRFSGHLSNALEAYLSVMEQETSD